MPRRTRPTVESLEGKALLSDLAFSVATDKPSYVVGQPVQLTFTETNISDHDVFAGYGPSIDGFNVTEGGALAWSSNDGINPDFIMAVTLHPGESTVLRATWDGVQNGTSPVSPVGVFRVLNQLDRGGASATFTVGAPAPVAGGPPGPGGGEVSLLYERILGRAPDPAGLDAALKVLSGGGTPAQIAGDLEHSAEYGAGVVASDYRGILRRAASPAEVAAGVSALQGGLTPRGLTASLLSSAEFNQEDPDDRVFVGEAYLNILGRSPENDAGVAALLSAGTSRSAVIGDLLGSTEASIDAVESDYQAVLDRQAGRAEIISVLAAWQSGRLTPDGLTTVLADSPEFAAQAGTGSAR